jgi:LysM repeat protein
VAGILLVATAGGAAAGGGWGPYRVAAGDSLWSLAARHDTTVERIRTMNGLTDDGLTTGELVFLPGSRSTAASSAPGEPASEAAGPPPGGHVVRSGESLSVLAARSGLTLAELAARNGLRPDDGLRIGQVLLLGAGPDAAAATAAGISPAGSGAATTGAAGSGAAGDASAGTPAGPDAAGPPASRAERVRTIQRMVRAEARRQGVNPALALAVASVESGFDPDAVSRTGAVGVMQLMPRTARWLATRLGRPVDRSDPADNIAGGVAFLRFLLAATSSDLPIAVGAYYQGLDSVRRVGFFPDTASYVAKVTKGRAAFAQEGTIVN